MNLEKISSALKWNEQGLVPAIAQDWQSGEVLLTKVEQIGGIACHTGRRSCFYRALAGEEWRETDGVITPPEDIYGDKS